MKKFFPAPADSKVWTVTAALIAFLVVLLTIVSIFMNMPSGLLWVFRVIIPIVTLILLIGLLAKPMRYDVKDDSVRIVRAWPFRVIEIPRSEISQVKHVRLGAIKPSPFAVGWIFGYTGKFRSAEQGDVIIFGTHPDHAVLIKANKNFVVTPAKPKKFVNEVLDRK